MSRGILHNLIVMSQPSMSPQDLKRRIKELEEENCQLALRLSRAGRHVNRLRMERKLLLERLEKVDPIASNQGEEVVAESVSLAVDQ